MSIEKYKLHIKKLSTNDIIAKISTTSYNDVIDVIQEFNFTGNDLISLEELEIKNRIGNKFDKQQVQRFKRFVFEVQKTPDKLFPLVQIEKKTPSFCKPDVKPKPLPPQNAQSHQRVRNFLEEKLVSGQQSKHGQNERVPNRQLPSKPPVTQNKIEDPVDIDSLSAIKFNIDDDAITTYDLPKPLTVSSPADDVYENFKGETLGYVKLKGSSEAEEDNVPPKLRQKRGNSYQDQADMGNKPQDKSFDTFYDPAPILEKRDKRKDSIHSVKSETIEDLTEYSEIGISADSESQGSSHSYDDVGLITPIPPALPHRPKELQKLQASKVKKIREGTAKRNNERSSQKCIEDNNQAKDHEDVADPNRMSIYRDIPPLNRPLPHGLTQYLDPEDYVTPLSVKSPKFMLQQHAFFRNVTRPVGCQLLEPTAIGTYLIRFSTKPCFFAVLMVKSGSKVLNVPINYDENNKSYSLEPEPDIYRPKFPVLNHLLQHYTKNVLNGQVLLSDNDNLIPDFGRKAEELDDECQLEEHKFFRDVSRANGNHLLENTKIGTFMLRFSSKECYFAVLMINGVVKIQHVPVYYDQTTKEYSLEPEQEKFRLKFNKLNKLLAFYATYAINADKLLTYSCNILPEWPKNNELIS